MRKRVMMIVLLALEACNPAKPAMPQLVLQPILYPDIVQAKLFGGGCNFVPANGGMGAVFMAQAKQGVIKIDDHVVPIALATNTAPLPDGAHTRYAGPLYAATLVPAPDGKHTTRGTMALFTGHLTITDAKGQTVYDATGDTQCNPT